MKVGEEVSFRMTGRITQTVGDFLEVSNGKKRAIVSASSIMQPRPANWPPKREEDPGRQDVWVDNRGNAWFYKKIETMPGKFEWKMTFDSSTGLIAWSARWFLAKNPEAKLIRRGGLRVV